MLTISTIPEALVELDKSTGRVWTDSELFDLATSHGIQLHAAPPITAAYTITEFVIGSGMVEKFSSPPGHAALAVLFPFQIGQLWIGGETQTSQVHRQHCNEGEYSFFNEPVRVTREQVRIKAETLQKILALWKRAQAGEEPRHRGPEWMFSVVPESTAISATLAPVGAVGASGSVEPTKAGPLPLTTGDIAFCFAGLRWKTETKWKKPLGDKPKWLAACIVIPAVRGVSETRWSPVCIGAALVRDEHAKPNSVRAKFQTQPLLKPWLDEWKTYEADNLSAD